MHKPSDLKVMQDDLPHNPRFLTLEKRVTKKREKKERESKRREKKDEEHEEERERERERERWRRFHAYTSSFT